MTPIRERGSITKDVWPYKNVLNTSLYFEGKDPKKGSNFGSF